METLEMSKNADLPTAPTIYADMGANGQREIFCDNQGLQKESILQRL